MTHIQEPNYTLDLPGEWEQVASDEDVTRVYREKDGTGTVSVTLLAVKPLFAIADQQRVLEDYLHHRSKFEQGKALSLEQFPATAQPVGDHVEGEWSGRDMVMKRRTRHRVLLVGNLLADFLFEAIGVDADEFEERANAILATATARVE